MRALLNRQVLKMTTIFSLVAAAFPFDPGPHGLHGPDLEFGIVFPWLGLILKTNSSFDFTFRPDWPLLCVNLLVWYPIAVLAKLFAEAITKCDPKAFAAIFQFILGAVAFAFALFTERLLHEIEFVVFLLSPSVPKIVSAVITYSTIPLLAVSLATWCYASGPRHSFKQRIFLPAFFVAEGFGYMMSVIIWGA